MRSFHYRRFPGDTIVVPMVIGVLLNSFVPQFLEIGSFWTAMTKNGTAPLVGVFLFFIGASMNIRSTGKAVAKGTVIILTKIVLAVLLGYAAAFLFHDNIFGLSSLAIIGAAGAANNALYSGIVATMGDDSDKGAVAITDLSVGPIVTMIALSSGAGIDFVWCADWFVSSVGAWHWDCGGLPRAEAGSFTGYDADHHYGWLRTWLRDVAAAAGCRWFVWHLTGIDHNLSDRNNYGACGGADLP